VIDFLAAAKISHGSNEGVTFSLRGKQSDHKEVQLGWLAEAAAKKWMALLKKLRAQVENNVGPVYHAG
jgi:hypothetical protein